MFTDPKQTTINKLKDHGFGIITVDENGTTTLQYSCIPLAQHISERALEAEIQGLTTKLKVCFKSAHATYRTNQGQGLQEAGQIIEALVNCMAKESVRLGFGTGVLRSAAADTIDNLYGLSPLKDHRAALGGARSFIKTYRNVSSHAPRSAREAMDKIKKCRAGFFDAIRIAKDLQGAMKAKGMRTSIHLT